LDWGERKYVFLQEWLRLTIANPLLRSFYHEIGTPQSEDVLAYFDAAHPGQFPDGTVSNDGQYVLFNIWRDCEPVCKLFVVDLEQAGNVVTSDLPFIKVVDKFDALYG